ncbi:MAG TPA: hypothetical protein VNA30_02285 [Mycobacteriales bacterium]|nr:hypothetical protein [Mycobacteriales bacterium]
MSDSPSATAGLALDAGAEREYSLPGSGSRSMLFVFDGQQIGAHAVSGSGDFVPGSIHPSVSLTFWGDAALAIVRPGASFDVWYGDTIGRGRVESVSWSDQE